MSGRNGYSIVISAVDKVSGTVDRINRKIAGSQKAANKTIAAAVAPWKRLGASIAETGKLLGVNRAAAGIARIATGFRNVGRASLDAFRNVARVVEPLSVITGALTIAGMVRLTTAWAQFGSQLGFAAQRIGVSASQLQGLQGAAVLAGGSANSLTSGLQGLGQTLYDAAGGRNTKAVALFQQLGISWRDGAGHARSVTAVLPQLADKIAAMRDPYAQAQAAAIAFGGAAEDLLPFLRLGSKGIAEYNAIAIRYGVMNERGVQGANDLRVAQAKVSLAVQGLTNSIAEKLAPVLTPLLTQMADWIARNREWIATKIGDAVRQVGDYIKGINWNRVGSAIKGIWDQVTGVANALGGWQDAATGLLAFMGVTWLAGMLAPIATIASAILGITTALIGLPAAAELAALGIANALAANEPGENSVRNDHPTALGRWIYDHMPALRWADNATHNAAKLAPDVDAEVRKDAAAAGNDPSRAVAWFRAEGGGYNNVSGAGAFGPAQLMPGTAKDYGVAQNVNDPAYDWRKNVGAGIAYQKDLLAKYHGNYDLAEAAYNWGPGNVDKWIAAGADPSRLPAETQRYIQTINQARAADDDRAVPYFRGYRPTPGGQPAVQIPSGSPDVDLPPNVTSLLNGMRAGNQNGQVDVHVRIDSSGGAKTTTRSSGSGVGKLRVETPMQAHAA